MDTSVDNESSSSEKVSLSQEASNKNKPKNVGLFITINLIALLCGGSGLFGAFVYFIERPLKKEVETLSGALQYAELDSQEQKFLIENYQARISQLEHQIDLADGMLSKHELDVLKKRLLYTHSQLESELSELHSNLSKLKSRGGSWFFQNAPKIASNSIDTANRAIAANQTIKQDVEKISKE
ncbi:hypothetical protein Q4574_11120 [Aliiglaciecola sp. 3_MG-2023]|uniref:hypothetical protein n=1 Tax=Aliiglaciecola sp. 3_MG-2023 TaxID=3062644 RepID=UPI0026E1411C|nr:hypothetical protein [Aliiglaciecola sp. 3_MG-2023]MDO6693840.1 hypothetical protein [Aliiglaciecola sp. 3_MG-2023]